LESRNLVPRLQALKDIYRAFFEFRAATAGVNIVITEVLRQLDSVSDARRERLVVADGIVPDIM